MSALKRFVFALFFLAFFYVVPSSHAQTFETTARAPIPPTQSVAVSKNDPHVYTQVMLIEGMSAIICQLTGIDPVNPKQGCVTLDPLNGSLTYNTPDPTKPMQLGGLLGLGSHAIGSLFVLPVHTSDFTRYLASNFGIVKHSYAVETGTGFNTLSPLLDLWTSFRNLAYILFVLIFILLGLGIMLRIHIDPRTVMTLQNQIPKVVVGIVLITLSYGIAGFLVDAMWVLTYAGTNILTEQPLCPDQTDQSFTKIATNNLNNPIGYVGNLLGDTKCHGKLAGIADLSTRLGFTFGDILSRTILEILHIDSNLHGCDPGITHPDIGDCVRVGFFKILKYLIGVAAILIIALAIIISLLRVWFSLIKSYARILLYTLFGPIYIMAGLLPNNSLGFSAWIRTFVANLLVFPFTIFLFIIASRFAVNSGINDPNTSFVPPLIGNSNIADNVGMIGAFAIIIFAPELINLLRDALKSPASKYGGAIGRGISSGAAPAGAAGGFAWGRLTRPYNPQTQEDPGFLRRAVAGGDTGSRRYRWTRTILGGLAKK